MTQTNPTTAEMRAMMTEYEAAIAAIPATEGDAGEHALLGGVRRAPARSADRAGRVGRMASVADR